MDTRSEAEHLQAARAVEAEATVVAEAVALIAEVAAAAAAIVAAVAEDEEDTQIEEGAEEEAADAVDGAAAVEADSRAESKRTPRAPFACISAPLARLRSLHLFTPLFEISPSRAIVTAVLSVFIDSAMHTQQCSSHFKFFSLCSPAFDAHAIAEGQGIKKVS